MLLALLMTSIISLSSCTKNEKIPKPENTNLEYWLLDKPNKKDWIQIDSNCYLAANYEVLKDENGNLYVPEYAVVYYIDNFPVSEFGIKKIDGIVITDPNVYVWGLTINSTREEMSEVLGKLGFMMDSNEKSCSAEKGQYRIKLTYGEKLEIHYWKFSLINTIIFGEKAYN